MRKSRELESVGRAIIKSIPDLKSAWPGKEKAGKGVSQREKHAQGFLSLCGRAENARETRSVIYDDPLNHSDDVTAPLFRFSLGENRERERRERAAWVFRRNP